MVAETLQLGIHLLSGGNKDIQKVNFFFYYCFLDVNYVFTIKKRCSIFYFYGRFNE